MPTYDEYEKLAKNTTDKSMRAYRYRNQEKLFHEKEPLITAEDFMDDYMTHIAIFISRGKPSPDTLKTYHSNIKQFLTWMESHQWRPLSLTEYQAQLYVRYLREHKYVETSVAMKIMALRAFYLTAQRLRLCTFNPFENVKADTVYTSDDTFAFFTQEELGFIQSYFEREPDEFLRYRNLLILYLMGVEGMRNVEVHRMNQEDIDWQYATITVHGKGRNRTLYPCAETMDILEKYLDHCPQELIGEHNYPLIMSNSKRNRWGRISRNGLRTIMNKALEATALKTPGVSCHVLRHSCGSNLYEQEKDLRLVQEVLGHRDPKTTSRYAHLRDRLDNRRTAKIVPTSKEK